MQPEEPTEISGEFINDKLTSIKKWVADKITYARRLAFSFFCVVLLSFFISLICRVSLLNYCTELQIRYPFEGVPFAQILVTVVSVFAWVLLKFLLSQLYGFSKASGEKNNTFLYSCAVFTILYYYLQFYACGAVVILCLFCWVSNFYSGDTLFGFDIRLIFSGAFAISIVLATLIPILIFEPDSRNEFLRLIGYGGGENVVVSFEESGGAERAKTIEGCLLLRTNTSIFLVPWKKKDVRIECPIDHVREIRYPKSELQKHHKTVLSHLGFKYHEEEKQNCGSGSCNE